MSVCEQRGDREQHSVWEPHCSVLDSVLRYIVTIYRVATSCQAPEARSSVVPRPDRTVATAPLPAGAGVSEALACAGTLPVMAGQIDYTLQRRAVLREFRSGLRSRLDICDAHPELMRAARYVGRELSSECPVCERENLRLVAYVYGDGLRRHRANGRCITQPRELEKLGSKVDEFRCYEVEVCPDCSWNHLFRSYLLGRRHAS